MSAELTTEAKRRNQAEVRRFARFMSKALEHAPDATYVAVRCEGLLIVAARDVSADGFEARIVEIGGKVQELAAR